MKRIPTSISIILLLLIFGSRPGIAFNLDFGLAGGINHTTIDYGEEYGYLDSHYRTLFNMTAFLEYPAKYGISLQAGLRFLKIGNQVDLNIMTLHDLTYPPFGFAPTPLNFEITGTFIAVPVKLKKYVRGRSGVYAVGGIEPMYLIRAHSEFIDIDGTMYDTEQTELFRNVNCSGILGLGAEHTLGACRLFIEFDYYHGFVRLSNAPDPIYRGKSREFSLNLGIRF